MTALYHLLENNRVWADEFYDRAAHGYGTDEPEYLWIGCCDGPFDIAARLGLEPGDLFIHRNLGNLVSGSDTNCLAALQYAVDILRVRHVIVCGHSMCRGVQAALSNDTLGVTDHWLSEIMELWQQASSAGAIVDRCLAEACTRNVRAQVAKLRHTRILRDARHQGRDVTVHGWMYEDDSGLFHDLSTDDPCADRARRKEAALTGLDSGQDRAWKIDGNDAATA